MIGRALLLAVAALLLLAMWYALGWLDAVLLHAHAGLAMAGAALGAGGALDVGQNCGARASGGEVRVYCPAARQLNITDYTCLVLANSTHYAHLCGPASYPLSPGTYRFAVVRYPSLRRDFAEALFGALPVALLVALVIAAVVMYVRRR